MGPKIGVVLIYVEVLFMPTPCIYKTRYPIVARRVQPLGRVRRASKGILHTSRHRIICMQETFARARTQPIARARR